MTYSGRFMAENETGTGLCKLITDTDDRIIGCHLLGNPASEIIIAAGIAVENGYTTEQFKKMSFPILRLEKSYMKVYTCNALHLQHLYRRLVQSRSRRISSKELSEDIFMLWQNEPAVVIGKHQNIWAEADMEFIQENRYG